MKKIRLPRKNALKPALPSSFWRAESIKAEVARLEVPFSLIECEFEQKQVEKKQVKAEKKTNEYILDPNRVKIYSIVLAKCKFSVDELRAAFQEMDLGVFSEANLEVFQGMLPSPEDVKVFNKFLVTHCDLPEDFEVERMAMMEEARASRVKERLRQMEICKTERFLLEFLMIRDVRDVVYFLQVMDHFNKLFDLLRHNINDYMEPFIQFLCQKRLPVLIRLMLRIVNFINNGGSGEHYQQKLTSLTMDLEGLGVALEAKGLLKRRHLIAFAVESLRSANKTYFNFARQLLFKKQEQYVLSELKGSLSTLELYLKKCENKLKQLQGEGFKGVEKFCDLLFNFIRSGYDKINRTRLSFQKFEKYLTELCQRFGFRRQSPDKVLRVFNRMIELVVEYSGESPGKRRGKQLESLARGQLGEKDSNRGRDGLDSGRDLQSSQLVFKMKDRIRMLKKRNLERKGVKATLVESNDNVKEKVEYFVNRKGYISFD